MGNLRFLTVFIFSILFSLVGFTQEQKELLLNGGFESGVAKWKSYCDAAGITPVDGVGGGVAGFAISASTTSPLAGKSSGIITKDAANRQGCGVATDFTVQEENKAQVLQVKIPYKVTSGTYADDQYKVYVYDIDNASMIEVAPTFIKNSSIKETYRGTFQTSLTGVNYRLIIHNASTSAVASTMKIEGNVSSQLIATGSFSTDMESYTAGCGGAWSTNTTWSCKKSLIGDKLYVIASATLSGAPNSAQFTVNLPSGFTIDTAKLNNLGPAGSTIGKASILDAGSQVYPGAVYYSSSTSVAVTYGAANGAGVNTNNGVVNQANPMTFGNTDVISVEFTVPVVGKTSNTVLSSEYISRLAAFSGSGVTSNAVGSNTVVKFSGYIDKLGAYNPTTGEVEVKTPGYYKIFAASLVVAGATPTVNQYVNYILHVDGNLVRQFPVYVQNTSVQSWAGSVAWEGDLVAGQKIRFLVDTNITSPTIATGTSQTYLQIHNGGEAVQVAAAEDCGVAANHGAGSSLASAGSTIVFENEEFDKCGEYDPGTGIFQPRNSGEYEIVYNLYSVNFTDTVFDSGVYKNVSTLVRRDDMGTKHPSLNRAQSKLSTKLKLLSSDNIRIKNISAHAGQNLYTADSFISIKRVGNY